jgi:uncharacterized protein YjbI with pentapeptide repeats
VARPLGQREVPGGRSPGPTFGDSRLAAVIFTQTTLDQVDLRGAAELGLVTDAISLRGAIVTSAQLTAMAPVLAETLGIVVADG